jgi:hypothetical protein
MFISFPMKLLLLCFPSVAALTPNHAQTILWSSDPQDSDWYSAAKQTKPVEAR